MVAFVAGAVLTAANLNASLNQLTIRTVTGTSDTLVLADQGGAVTYSNASATTSTIPPNSSVAFAVGTKIVLINLGAGVVTVTAGAGVTVNGTPLTLAQNAGGTCIKTATNTWSFLPFSSGVGAANFSDAATGTYTGFKYKTFTASGTLTVTTAGFADVVIVGGGGGGTALGGGAGGGGVFNQSNVYLAAGTLTATVGAGGAAIANTGISSSLGVYVAAGGGGGGGQGTDGRNGGSGGGGGYSSSGVKAGGTATTGQGFAGGATSSTVKGGSGGGGAGAVGTDSTTGNTGKTGGAGVNVTIGGTTPSGAYVAGNYAVGGGGGGGGYNANGGAGGGFGAGAGGGTSAAVAGTANTGGGGGAGGYNGGGVAGAPGGSGLIIVRVAV